MKSTLRAIAAVGVLLLAQVSEAQDMGLEAAVEGLTAKGVHSVFPWEFGFQLQRGDETSAKFLFYGEEADGFVGRECSPGAVFHIVSTSGRKGAISIGVCTEQDLHPEILVTNARRRAEGMIAELKKIGREIDEAGRERLGWQIAKMVLADGSELHYFPVLAVGHGILTAPTALLVSGGKVVVIQAGTMRLCHYDEHDPKLCTHAKDGFFELLRQVESKASAR